MLKKGLQFDYLKCTYTDGGLRRQECVSNFEHNIRNALVQGRNFDRVKACWYMRNWQKRAGRVNHIALRWIIPLSLQCRYNERDVVSNHRRFDCFLDLLFRRISKKTPKLRVSGLFVGNPLVIGAFPSQRAGDAENVSIWWRQGKSVIQMTWYWE